MYLHQLNKNISKKKMDSIQDYLIFLNHFLIQYFFKNIIFIVIITFIFLNLKGESLVQKSITFLLCGLSAYLGHILAHKSNLWNRISNHIEHHDEKKTFIRDFKEFLSDVFASGFLLLIINIIFKKFNGYSLLNNYVIVLFMIGFPSVHLINYHFFLPKSFHSIHHENVNSNFSPDIYDHLFNTNKDHHFENLNHMLPNFIILALIVITLTYFKDKVYLNK